MNDDGDRVLNVFFFTALSFFIPFLTFGRQLSFYAARFFFSFRFSYFMLSMTTGNDGYMLPIQRRRLLRC